MLSQALKSGVSGVSSSSCISTGLASSQLSHSVLAESDVQCSLENENQLHVSLQDDVDTPKYAKGEEEEDAEPFWTSAHEADGSEESPYSAASGIDALCRSFVASASFSRPTLTHANTISGIEISVPSHSSSNSNTSTPFPTGMVARSCPKPIVMPRRSRQGSLANHDELSVFVPPHELAASSLLDPTNVSDSLCRKGSAAIRLRSGVLRRTGFLEGHTETLKPQTSITSFRQ